MITNLDDEAETLNFARGTLQWQLSREGTVAGRSRESLLRTSATTPDSLNLSRSLEKRNFFF